MKRVSAIIDQMRGVGKPQKKFLASMFSTILVVRGRHNFLNFSRYSPYNERTIRRQYRREFDFTNFNMRLLKREDKWEKEVRYLLGQDASFIAKSGKKTHGLDYFFNGCASRAEKGLEISLVSLIDLKQHTAYAVSARQTPPKQLLASRVGTGKAEPEFTRIDFYLAHLREVIGQLPPEVKHGVFDGYYAKRKFIDGVCEIKLEAISKLRSDADMRYLDQGKGSGPRRAGRPRLYDGKVSLDDLSRFENLGEVETGIHLYTAVVYHIGLKRKIRLLTVIDRSGNKPRYVLLFSTDCEMAGIDIYHYYKARFQLEFLFRDAKQYSGLSDCQARDEQALNFHFNMALSTVNLTKLEAFAEHKIGEGLVFSLASIKQRAFNQHYLDLIISKLAFEPSLIKNHPDYEYLANYGAIAA